MHTFLRSFVLPIGIVCTLSAQDPSLEHFEKKIWPVLAARCQACQGSSTVLPQGGLRLDSVSGILKGGNSGPILKPGDPDRSLLV